MNGCTRHHSEIELSLQPLIAALDLLLRFRVKWRRRYLVHTLKFINNYIIILLLVSVIVFVSRSPVQPYRGSSVPDTDSIILTLRIRESTLATSHDLIPTDTATMHTM
jgi:hypothetical protein